MLLGLDTATEWLHLALVDPLANEKSWTLVQRVEQRQSHSTLLLSLVDDLLKEAGADSQSLTGVVTCVGPGGFTSLRTGVATAEGLALTGMPTWGFSAFELRAKALQKQGVKAPFWILLDGQRGEAFAQRFSEQPERAQKLPFAGLDEALNAEPWWASESFRSKMAPFLKHPPLSMVDEENALLDALVSLCREKTVSPAESPLVPFYLRETDAEVNFPQHSHHLSPALRRGHDR